MNANVILRAAVMALGALILVSGGSGIAAAHTALASANPATDATVTASPGAIVLTFTEDFNPAFANVAVSSLDGRNWVTGAPRVHGSRLTAAGEPPPVSLGSDTKTSILAAAAAGLTLGGVITFWQSRRRRRRNAGDDDGPRSPPSAGT